MMADSKEGKRLWHQKPPNVTTLTATVIEGAEVVRTPVVSYATPILHKVFIQGCPLTKSVSSLTSPYKVSINKVLTDAVVSRTNTTELVSRLPSSSPVSTALMDQLTSNNYPDSVQLSLDSPLLPSLVSSSGTSCSSSIPVSSTSSSDNCYRNDDELTSLSWLQDVNLLKGTSLMSPVKSLKGVADTSPEKRRFRYSKKCKNNKLGTLNNNSEPSKSSVLSIPAPDLKIESPTSDFGEEILESSDSEQYYVNGQVPYDPKVHIKEKPPFSFSTLIFMAIEDSYSKSLPVKDIYTWILNHYPYYKGAPSGWKNSVRHNLSLNKCFCKVDKSPTLGKGSLWMVDQAHRPNLIQAITKSPVMLATSNSFLKKFKVRSIESLSSPKDENNFESSDYSSNTNNTTVSKRLLVTKQYHGGNVSSFKPSHKRESFFNGPDPELFPRLARRLELHVDRNSMICGEYLSPMSVNVQSEDVDAAAAMLVLKHGRKMIPGIDSYNCSEKFDKTSNAQKRKRTKSKEIANGTDMVTRSSANLDHAYFCETSKRSKFSKTLFETNDSSSSIDEAFYDDSYARDCKSDQNLYSSQSLQLNKREHTEAPLKEEENALLNLASIATSLASRLDCSDTTQVSDSESHLNTPETQLKTVNSNGIKSQRVMNRKKTSVASPKSLSLSRKSPETAIAKTRNCSIARSSSVVNQVAKSSFKKSSYNNNTCGVHDRNKMRKAFKKTAKSKAC